MRQATRPADIPSVRHVGLRGRRWCVDAVFAGVNCIGLEMEVSGSFVLIGGADLRSM